MPASAGSGGRAPVLLCLTPAPAIDRTARVDRVVSGEVLRPSEVVALPGGKGVNAARAAARLGGQVTTSGLAGGHAGRWIVSALRRERLDPRFASAAAESRTTYVVVDGRGRSIIVYEPPGPATPAEFATFIELLERELLPGADRVIVAGSLPGGIPEEGYARIVTAAQEAGRPILVDASGGGLRAALAARPDIVKVGLEEVREALPGEAATARDAAAALVARGARTALVTDGPREAAASDGARGWAVEVPAVQALNPVGSGDAVNAGLSLALAEGQPIEAALARGVAAGSANARSLSAGDLDPVLVDELARRVRVATLAPAAG